MRASPGRRRIMGACSRLYQYVSTILLCLFVIPFASAAGDRGSAASGSDLVDSWVLVRLSEPLTRQLADGSYSVQTGREDLDRAIERHRVERIEIALTSVSRSDRDTEIWAQYGLDRYYKFHVRPGTAARQLADELASVPGVAHAEPDVVARAFAKFPNDPLFDQQWGLHQASDADVDAPEAWEHETGAGVLIAILDTGVDTDHPDLAGKLVLDDAWDFVNDDDDPEDDHGHGTAMGSLAAARTDNGVGMAGTCWDCPVLPVKIFDEDGVGTFSAMADGLVWACDHGARVVNVSGGDPASPEILESALSYCVDAGVIITASVGEDFLNRMGAPARYRETVSASGTDASDEHYSESARGHEVDVVAPAVDVLSAHMDGSYQDWTGSSCAAPRVAGAVGILQTVHPSIGREEARHLLISGAEDEVGRSSEDVPGFDHYHGWGRLNIDRSVSAARSLISLRVEDPAATRLSLETSSPMAESYDFARGDLGNLSESTIGVQLGKLTCIENDSVEPDTVGDEDSEQPAPGGGFFYLARLNAAPGAGWYGGSSRNRDRRVLRFPDWEVVGGQGEAWMGYSGDSAGDVNGDGYDDVIVGAYGYDGAQVDAGLAQVYLGGPGGLASSPVWSMEGDLAGAGFGFNASSAGDVNADGYDDIIVSAWRRDGEYPDEGRVYVYHGSPSGPEATPAWWADGGQEGSNFGVIVNGAGDVNGDGFDDAIVAAPLYDDTEGDVGRVWIYRGSENGLEASASWIRTGDQAGARLGTTANTAGDVNGDGYGDVVVGAKFYDGGDVDEGRAWVFHGGPSGVESSPAAMLEVDASGARFGSVGGGAGDVNADGYDDVIIGASHYGDTAVLDEETFEGRAFLFNGSGSGVETEYSWSYESDQAFAYLSAGHRSIGGAGDVNEDGIDDLVVGAYGFRTTRTVEGRVWVFHGSASGPSTDPDWGKSGLATDEGLGILAASAGDTNGDGISDLLMGASDHNDEHTDEGRAIVFYGPLSEEGDCPR
jgi:hypothetical protein